MDRRENLTIQAENSVAGSLLLEPYEVLKNIHGVVSADDFLNDAARAVFQAVRSLVDSGKPCDPLTIQRETERQGTPVSSEYCAECMEVTPTTANSVEYAGIVHDAALRRREQSIGLSLAQGDISSIEALANLQTLQRAQSGTVHSPAEAAQRAMDFFSAAADGRIMPFVKTGYRDLDGLLSGGLVTGGLITEAARPGTGKSTLAICIAEYVASVGGNVLYFSLEMTEQQLWACRVANVTGLSRDKVYDGSFLNGSDHEVKQFVDAFDLLSRREFRIRDMPSTVEDIEREARCINGLSLLVVDHIGLVSPSQGMRGSRYECTTYVSHRLKQLALSLKIPILALCQLNRASLQRPNQRPTMADLRDSGAIEEDSDVVILLYRENDPEKQWTPWAIQDIDLIVDKNRHGRTGIVGLKFCGENSRVFQ